MTKIFICLLIYVLDKLNHQNYITFSRWLFNKNSYGCPSKSPPYNYNPLSSATIRRTIFKVSIENSYEFFNFQKQYQEKLTSRTVAAQDSRNHSLHLLWHRFKIKMQSKSFDESFEYSVKEFFHFFINTNTPENAREKSLDAEMTRPVER